MKSWLKKIKSKNVYIIFVNRKAISAKCIFAEVSSLFLDRFFIFLPTRAPGLIFFAQLLTWFKFVPGKGRQGWANDVGSAHAGWHHRYGLQHFTPAFVYSAFIDFSHNVTITLCNQQQKGWRTDSRDRCCLPRPWQTSWETRNPSLSVLGRSRQSGQLCKLSPQHPSWWAGSPSTLQLLAQSPPPVDPGVGVDLIQSISVWFTHCHHHHADCRPARGAAKPGTREGGGEESWELFSPRSTTEANALCNLILHA